ncbi:MAG: hypothetical protein FWG18_02795, partial [Alphaproteobacteria bacterium]|nr:hypothetical protein [Alphaproteobacteria bacterium]
SAKAKPATKTPEVKPAPTPTPTLPLQNNNVPSAPEPNHDPFVFNDSWMDYDFDSDTAPTPAQPPLAVANPFVVGPAPILTPAPFDDYADEVYDCLEFAFPGFNLAGRQAGWIRPYGGAYYFHPFGDGNCENPTGVYNVSTGMITDINNPSKTIGSDSERVGFRALGGMATIPTLSNPANARPVNRAQQLTTNELRNVSFGGFQRFASAPPPAAEMLPSSMGAEAIVSSPPYDRTFVLRQFKPIPATIVNEVRADPKRMSRLPVQATVDRNVYSDNGRTIVIPTGTLMLGYITGDLPGPYQSIGRMDIRWYRFVRPDGVEFNFDSDRAEPFSGDSQGRVGVPGHGHTDYIESMIMPMITALVPAAVNLIAPISDRFVNQIDLDNNTVTQSGQVRSSELAKQEIISTWNRVVQKLAIDMLDNTTPPFSIASGTRITVYSPNDLIVTCGDPQSDNRNCAITAPRTSYAGYKSSELQQFGGATTVDYSHPSWIGQVRSLNINTAELCDQGRVRQGLSLEHIRTLGFNDFRLAEAWCQTNLYQGRTQAAYDTYYQNLSTQGGITGPGGQILQQGTPEYNQQILGLNYNDQGQIQNPFLQQPKAPAAVPGIMCPDTGTPPDASGCCPGELLTDMGIDDFGNPIPAACCPPVGDCFPPII